MLASLSHCYQVTCVALPRLDHASLAPIDVLILCTTEGPPLEAEELASLRSWVAAGGALIASGFANWSRHGHFAATTVGWLGIVTRPHAAFGPSTSSAFEPHARTGESQPYAHGESATGELAPATSCAETTALLDFSRFGMPQKSLRFSNFGETHFAVTDEAFEAGAVQLVVHEGDSRLNLLPKRLANLVFYPPRSAAKGGVTGLGRVLVCSNYHWIADEKHWNGGKVSRDANLPLLHNFVAGAVAARTELAGACSDAY